MVDSEVRGLPSTVLTGVIIAPEDFALGKLDLGAGAADHLLQSDDGGRWVGHAGSVDVPPAIDDQFGFASDEQAQGATGVADVEGLVAGIEDQHGSIEIVGKTLAHACEFYLNSLTANLVVVHFFRRVRRDTEVAEKSLRSKWVGR